MRQQWQLKRLTAASLTDVSCAQQNALFYCVQQEQRSTDGLRDSSKNKSVLHENGTIKKIHFLKPNTQKQLEFQAP